MIYKGRWKRDRVISIRHWRS